MYDHTNHSHASHATWRMAASATLHCLTGCAIGEVLGLMISTALGLDNLASIIIAIVLAFVFGFGLSAWPLVKAGLSFGVALSLVATADTLSIATMEVVDNGVMVAIPGAMYAGLLDGLFWVSMAISLVAAFMVAVPVNYALLRRGKGHAVTMRALGHDHSHH